MYILKVHSWDMFSIFIGDNSRLRRSFFYEYSITELLKSSKLTLPTSGLLVSTLIAASKLK